MQTHDTQETQDQPCWPDEQYPPERVIGIMYQLIAERMFVDHPTAAIAGAVYDRYIEPAGKEYEDMVAACREIERELTGPGASRDMRALWEMINEPLDDYDIEED